MNAPAAESGLHQGQICRGIDDADRVANARIAGATPLFEWIGDEAATVFRY